MGALPVHVPTNFADLIRQTLDKTAYELSEVNIAKIKAIQSLAEQKPMVAWRVLSQDKIRKVDGYYFKDAVFRAGWHGSDMVLPLTNPETLAILHDRVGALPDFAPSRPVVPGSNVQPLKPVR